MPQSQAGAFRPSAVNVASMDNATPSLVASTVTAVVRRVCALGRWAIMVSISGSVAYLVCRDVRVCVPCLLEYPRTANAWWVAVAFAATAASAISSGTLWYSILRRRWSGRLRLIDAGRLYFTSVWARYLPGRVWTTVARTMLAKNQGVPVRPAAESALLEATAGLASASLLGVISAPVLAGRLPLVAYAVVSLPCLALLFPPVLNSVLRAGLHRKGLATSEVPSVRIWDCIAWMVIASIGWLFAAVSVAATAWSVDARIGLTESLAAVCWGWLAGLAAWTIPGGLGASEYVRARVLYPQTGLSVAWWGAIVFRVLQVLAELTILLSFSGLVARSRRSEGDGSALRPFVRLRQALDHRLAVLAVRAVVRWYWKRPEHAHFLEAKYRTCRQLLALARNEICYRLQLPWSVGPITLVVEPTNRCNLRCVYCPVNNGMRRAKGELEPALLQRVLDENPQVRAILLSHWGEPLLHPEIARLIRIAVERNVYTVMYTNGELLTEVTMDSLIRVGLNNLVVSIDGSERYHLEYRGTGFRRLQKRIEQLLAKRREHQAPLVIDASMVVTPESEEVMFSARERLSKSVDHIHFQPLMEFSPATKRTPCRELWRGNLVVLWNGTVTPCGVDLEGDLALGNASESPLRSLINGPRLVALRKAHLRGDFPDVCQGCREFESTRLGARYR